MKKEYKPQIMAHKGVEAEALIGNSAPSIPFHFEFDQKGNGHTLMIGSTRNGMSAMFDILQAQYANAGGAVQVVDVGPTTRR